MRYNCEIEVKEIIYLCIVHVQRLFVTLRLGEKYLVLSSSINGPPHYIV